MSQNIFVDKEAIDRVIQFLIHDRYSPLASQISNEMLATELIVGLELSFSQQKSIKTLDVNTVLDAHSRTKGIILKAANTPFHAGSRQAYDVVPTFKDIDTAKALKSILDIAKYDIVTLEELLIACVNFDKGLLIFGDNKLAIIEPDRINEYVRASFESSHDVPTNDSITDIAPHKLTDTELARLQLLIQQQDWIQSCELASAKIKGNTTNLLVVEGASGISRDELDAKCFELSKLASKIKTPFVIIGMTQKELCRHQDNQINDPNRFGL